MKVTLHALMAAAALALAQPAFAATNCGLGPAPVAPDAGAPAAARAAHDLASLYYPEDLITAMVERQSRIAFEQGVRETPGGERVLAELPGLVEAGFTATMGVIRPCVVTMVPVLQHRAAEVMAQRLSVAHMRSVAEFYRSDVGRATMDAIANNVQPPQPRLRPDGTIEPMTRDDFHAALPPDILWALTPAQRSGLAAFASSPHGRAFMAIAPQLEQLTLASVNQINAAAQPEVEAAVQAAIEDYIRRNPPRRRGS